MIKKEITNNFVLIKMSIRRIGKRLRMEIIHSLRRVKRFEKVDKGEGRPP